MANRKTDPHNCNDYVAHDDKKVPYCTRCGASL